MARPSDSVPDNSFEDKYRHDFDPWDFETSAYEQEKYRTSLGALPRVKYNSALEIGCSIGVFTELLAERCTALLAIDVSETAVERARKRCAHLSHVTVRQESIPSSFPHQLFDLIVLSEVGYYWSLEDLTRARHLMIDRLEPDGQILLVHWTGQIDDAPLRGDTVHDLFRNGLLHVAGIRHESYRLDVMQLADTPGGSS